MTKRKHLVLLAALGLAGCSSARGQADAPAVAFGHEPQRATDSLSRTHGAAPPDVAALEADTNGRLVVAPDRALVRIDATVPAPSRAAADGRRRQAVAQLTAELSDGQACVVSVADLGSPQRAGDDWQARASLRLDVPLSGAAGAAARMARIERCMARFESLGPDLREVRLAVSDPLVTIDAPWRHRATLLERALGPLREVAAVQDAPAAYDPAGLRCTSRGRVSIVARSLNGVALEVDLDCRRRGEAAEAAEASPS